MPFSSSASHTLRVREGSRGRDLGRDTQRVQLQQIRGSAPPSRQLPTRPKPKAPSILGHAAAAAPGAVRAPAVCIPEQDDALVAQLVRVGLRRQCGAGGRRRLLVGAQHVARQHRDVVDLAGGGVEDVPAEDACGLVGYGSVGGGFRCVMLWVRSTTAALSLRRCLKRVHGAVSGVPARSPIPNYILEAIARSRSA